MLGRVRALIADAVDRLYLEAVEGVSPQVADQHPGLRQAQLARDEVHVVVAVGAGAPVGPALLAHYVVDDIFAAARLPGRVPLEDHRGFVHNGNHIPRAGWDTYGHAGKRCRPNGDLHPQPEPFYTRGCFILRRAVTIFKAPPPKKCIHTLRMKGNRFTNPPAVRSI